MKKIGRGALRCSFWDSGLAFVAWKPKQAPSAAAAAAAAYGWPRLVARARLRAAAGVACSEMDGEGGGVAFVGVPHCSWAQKRRLRSSGVNPGIGLPGTAPAPVPAVQRPLTPPTRGPGSRSRQVGSARRRDLLPEVVDDELACLERMSHA